MDYTIISADGHVDLRYMPGDAFTSRASSTWKDRVPQIIDTPDGPRWYADGIDLRSRPAGGLANLVPPARGTSKHIDRMYEAGLYEGEPHPTTPDLRRRDTSRALSKSSRPAMSTLPRWWRKLASGSFVSCVSLAIWSQALRRRLPPAMIPC